jgi:alpha-L-fucosidase
MFRFLFVFLFISQVVFAQQKYAPEWSSLDARPVPQWFTDAKFGIFIHWGVYAVPSWAPVGRQWGTYAKYSEWYWHRFMKDTSAVGTAFRNFHFSTYGPQFRYPDFAPQFRAELFRPDEWASLFQASGARYVVLTSKHHDGYTLWPSAQSWNWNSMDIGPHRDLAGDLSAAVKAKGLVMGFYYSLYEWFNPLYQQDVHQYVDQHMQPQMKDLVQRYRPHIFWTDGEWDHPSATWKSPQFLAWLFNESSVGDSVVVNDRWGSETRGKHGGFYTTEYDHGKENIRDHPWEESRGIGGSYGYNRAESLKDYHTAKELIALLVEKVSGGGNLLLDIGPAADGTIPVIMQQRLQEIGQWLQVNGEAIYGTRKWMQAPPAQKDQTVFFTAKGNDLYVILTEWPQVPVQIKGIRKAGTVKLLGAQVPVRAAIRNGLTIFPPALTPAQNPSPHAWVFKVEAVE